MTGGNMTNYDMDEVQRRRDRKIKRDSEWIDSIKEDHPYLILLEPQATFNQCVIGIVERINLTCLCYNTLWIIEALINDMEMSPEDAWEHYSFNIQDSFMGLHSPVFLTVEKGE